MTLQPLNCFCLPLESAVSVVTFHVKFQNRIWVSAFYNIGRAYVAVMAERSRKCEADFPVGKLTGEKRVDVSLTHSFTLKYLKNCVFYVVLIHFEKNICKKHIKVYF